MNDLSFSQQGTITRPADPHMLAIDENNWRRLKSMTAKVIERNPIFQNLACVFLGLAGSAAFGLVGYYTVPKTAMLPSWVLPTLYLSGIASIIIAGAFFFCDASQKKISQLSLNAVLDEFELQEKHLNLQKPTP